MQVQINTVRENTTIIGRSKNWLNLAFRESLAIKERRPELNKGLKSCKDLALFWDALTSNIWRQNCDYCNVFVHITVISFVRKLVLRWFSKTEDQTKQNRIFSLLSFRKTKCKFSDWLSSYITLNCQMALAFIPHLFPILVLCTPITTLWATLN